MRRGSTLCTKRIRDWLGRCFSSFYVLKKKLEKQEPVLRPKKRNRWKISQSKWGSTFPFMLSFSAFLCLPTSCFPWDCGGPMSRGTPASENQSPRQTTREHKGVNDKQMKGRISDTCSLPLFLCLPPSVSLSPTCISFLVTAPLPPSLFFSAWACHSTDWGGCRWSEILQKLQTQGRSSSLFLSLLSLLLSVSSSHTA